jgi:hypothetical protein
MLGWVPIWIPLPPSPTCRRSGVFIRAAGRVAGLTFRFYRNDSGILDRGARYGVGDRGRDDLTRLRYWMQVGAERRAIRPLEAR